MPQIKEFRCLVLMFSARGGIKHVLAGWICTISVEEMAVSQVVLLMDLVSSLKLIILIKVDD